MSPHDLLPLPHPAKFDPGVEEPNYFYNNVVKPLIPDFIKLMGNGLFIDRNAVEELRTTVNNVVQSVHNTLATNKIIEEFQEAEYPKQMKIYLEEMESRKRTIDKFIKPFKDSNKIHRTYVVNTFLEENNLSEYKLDSWLLKDIKDLLLIVEDPFLYMLVNKETNKYNDNTYIKLGMQKFAEDKLYIYNKSHYDDVVSKVTKDELVPKFNPGSSLQLTKLFEYLGYEPLALTKKGNPSWGRGQIEEVKYTVDESNTDLHELLQAFIDYSFSDIIKTNFMEAFDKFIIDEKLYGNLKLFGAKSFRPTSNSPNLLNTPSTKSLYAKPLKKCFIAPEGYLVWTIDYSALEDRVIANLSGDENKLNIFLEGLDG